MKIPNVLDPKIKWGVAGCGKFAETKVIPTLKMLQSSRVVSVFSRNQKRATEIAQKFSIKEHFDNYERFLESDFNCLYVASANIDHKWQVIEAAKKGKNIICEKPLAINSGDVKEMVEICGSNNVVFSVGYLKRFHPLCIKAKELIEAGMLGKIVVIHVSQASDYPPNDNNYRFKKELSGGGVLWDVGTHCIDLLRFFGGEIKNIQGKKDNIIYQSEVEDFVSAIVKFEKGYYGSFYSAYCISKPINRIEIMGYKGTIVIDGLIGRMLKSPKMTISIEGQVKKAFRKGGNDMLNLLREFKESVIKGKKMSLNGEDGLKNILLIEELEKS